MAKNTIADLSTTSANNTDVIGQSTAGSASANTLDTINQNELALLARWYGDTGGLGTVGGSANAITLTSLSTYQSLTNGLQVTFKAGSANSGATTLNLDGLGVKKVRRQGDTALAAGDIKANGRYKLIYDTAYDSAAGAWILMDPGQMTGDAGSGGTTGLVPAPASGDAAAVKYLRADATWATIPTQLVAATQAEQEAASSTTVFVTPGRQQYHPGVVKFWAFVKVSAGTPALTTSHNVTSITDSGVGQLTVTIATDFSTANWPCFVTIANPDANPRIGFESTDSAKTAGSVVVNCTTTGGSFNDPASWSVMGLGDQ